MAIRKRGASWQIDLMIPTGQRDEDGKEIKTRYRKTFVKKKDADAEHDKMKTLVREGRFLDVKKDYRTTLGELIEKYKESFNWQPGFLVSKRFWLENFRNHFGKDIRLAVIGYVDIEGYRNHLRKKPTRRSSIRKNSSINREMSCLRHMFKKAVSWDMMEKSPFNMGESLLLKENNMRKRFLSEDEIVRLLKECESKNHLRRIVICALNTGMRRKEILTLKWNQIRNGFIYLEKTKTDEKREIPINESLAEVLSEIRREQGLSSQYVFLYGEKTKRTILRLDRAFMAAVRRAEIEDFRFHDLRHTFASHLVMKGASLKEVQELLGHKTMTMTLRYAHLAEEHKKKAVNLLNGLTAPVSKASAEPSMSQNVTNLDSHRHELAANYLK